MTRAMNSVRYPSGTVIETTPWASGVLTPTQLDLIETWAPRGSTVDIGAASPGEWTVKVRLGGIVIGDAYRYPNPILAAQRACERARNGVCIFCVKRPGDFSIQLPDGSIAAVCDTCGERGEEVGA